MNTHDIISPDLEDYVLGTFYVEVNEPWEGANILSSIGSARAEAVKNELSRIIKTRLWHKTFYEGLWGLEFETENGFYTYLEEIWQYAFNDGPLPCLAPSSRNLIKEIQN